MPVEPVGIARDRVDRGGRALCSSGDRRQRLGRPGALEPARRLRCHDDEADHEAREPDARDDEVCASMRRSRHGPRRRRRGAAGTITSTARTNHVTPRIASIATQNVSARAKTSNSVKRRRCHTASTAVTHGEREEQHRLRFRPCRPPLDDQPLEGWVDEHEVVVARQVEGVRRDEQAERCSDDERSRDAPVAPAPDQVDRSGTGHEDGAHHDGAVHVAPHDQQRAARGGRAGCDVAGGRRGATAAPRRGGARASAPAPARPTATRG